jgi:hypothetical protein
MNPSHENRQGKVTHTFSFGEQKVKQVSKQVSPIKLVNSKATQTHTSRNDTLRLDLLRQSIRLAQFGEASLRMR